MSGIDNLKPWKKGQSGNPKGRPKGSRNRSTIVKELIEAKNKETGALFVDEMTRALIVKALDGDVRAFQELMDSAYGKNTDKIQNEVKLVTMDNVKIGDNDLDFDVGSEAKERDGDES